MAPPTCKINTRLNRLLTIEYLFDKESKISDLMRIIHFTSVMVSEIP